MSAVLFLQTKPNIQYISNTKHQLSADNVKNIFGHKWITHTMYLKKKILPFTTFRGGGVVRTKDINSQLFFLNEYIPNINFVKSWFLLDWFITFVITHPYSSD